MVMRDYKSLWDELRRAIGDWMVGDEESQGEQADDPALLFHLCVSAPLFFGLVALWWHA